MIHIGQENCKVDLINRQANSPAILAGIQNTKPPRTPRKRGEKLNHDGTADTTEYVKKMEPPMDANERK
jgi:hypothetical protein